MEEGYARGIVRFRASSPDSPLLLNFSRWSFYFLVIIIIIILLLCFSGAKLVALGV